MNSQERVFRQFAEFAAKLKDDEKSEAQDIGLWYAHTSPSAPRTCRSEEKTTEFIK
jgi:hypothetical protein